jgi:hypothetical protein
LAFNYFSFVGYLQFRKGIFNVDHIVILSMIWDRKLTAKIAGLFS